MKKEMPKTIYIIVIIIFNIFLLLALIAISTLLITQSTSFYMFEYNKNNTLVKSGYNLEQLRVITKTVIEYLFNKVDSMQVVINDIDVFSVQALKHMADVKTLYQGGIIIGVIALVITCILAAYIFLHYKYLKKYLLKTTLITFGVIIGILIIVVGLSALNFDLAFEVFHKIIFPDSQKFDDAFFSSYSNYPEKPGVNNLMLVTILSQGLFMDAGLLIVASTVVCLIVWLIIILILRKKDKTRSIIYG